MVATSFGGRELVVDSETDSEDEDYVPSEHEDETGSVGDDEESGERDTCSDSATDKKGSVCAADRQEARPHVEAIWNEMKLASRRDTSPSMVDRLPINLTTVAGEMKDTSGVDSETSSSKRLPNANNRIDRHPDRVELSARPRVSRIDHLVNSLGKQPKMSTLEKSRLDWHSYVETANVTDELEQNRKDGYLERLAFLRRTDERQFSREQQQKKRHRPV